MQESIGWLWGVGFYGLLAVANAQTPSSSAGGAAFDGTYALVSSAKVNETYRTRGGQLGQCSDRIAGPLTVTQGQARYTSATGLQLRGTVGPQGELALRSLTPPGRNGYQPLDVIVNGRIDDTGSATRPSDRQFLQLRFRVAKTNPVKRLRILRLVVHS